MLLPDFARERIIVTVLYTIDCTEQNCIRCEGSYTPGNMSKGWYCKEQKNKHRYVNKISNVIVKFDPFKLYKLLMVCDKKDKVNIN